MDLNDVHALWTLATFLVFIGIVWWAYSGRRAPQFARAQMAPFDDEAPVTVREDQ